jgi:glutathione S-transferase
MHEHAQQYEGAHWCCAGPFCHRVLLTLETKHIPYEMDYIDFNNKPQW